MALWPYSVRAPEFRLFVQGPGGVIEEVPPPPPRTYRGEIVGELGSVVAASLVTGKLTALAVMPDGIQIPNLPFTGMNDQRPVHVHPLAVPGNIDTQSARLVERSFQS